MNKKLAKLIALLPILGLVACADTAELYPGDAYIGGDTSALSERDKETLDMAKAVIKEYITDGMTDCEKEEASFAENTKRLLDIISNYSLEVFSISFGPRLDDVMIPYITGIDNIDYPIYRILIVFYLIQIIISENAAFVSYYSKELFSNT